MRRLTIKLLILWSLVLLGGSPAVAESSEDASFDDVLREFSSGQKVVMSVEDPLAGVLIHLGAGFVSSFTSLELPGRASTSALLSGFEAHLGIDLLSKHWLAEGSVRSFNNERLSSGETISMKEFDLKTIYRGSISRVFGFRLGAGLAARYLSSDGIRGIGESSYSTPASILLAGLRTEIGKSFSILAEVSFRNALISETPDKSALQASIRLDGHF